MVQRINYNLCTSDGLPLGLVTAAHQISSLTYFVDPEFTQSCRLPLGIRAKFSRVSLLATLIVVFLLTLFMGPSSAVGLIPRLDWWHHPNPHPEGSERAFLRYKASDLWPTSITKDLIPQNCADPGSPDAENCPTGGYEMVKNWVGAHQSQGQEPNITVPGHRGVARLLASSMDDEFESGFQYDSIMSPLEYDNRMAPIEHDGKTFGSSNTSTVGYREAWDLGAFWQYSVRQNRSVAETRRPRIAPRFIDRSPIRKPVVEVVCAAEYEWSTRDPAQSQNESWLVQFRSHPKFDGLFSDTVEGKQMHLGQVPTAFTWINTSDIVDGPSIGAVFAPTAIFFGPRSDLIIREQASPFDPMYSPTQMTIATDWADAMNPNLTDANGIETTYIQNMIERYNSNSSSSVILSEPGYGQESIPWRISTALGLYLTEALTRVHATSNNGTVLCHTNARKQEKVFMLGDLDADEPQWWPQNQSFIDYAHEQGWAELEFRVARYGYSWSFEGRLVKAAVAVLVMQALIGLAHICYIISGGLTIPSWSTMGEMLILAIDSSPSARLQTAALTPKGRYTLWSETVQIRKTKEKKLELVLDGGLPPEKEREAGLTMPRKRKNNG
ncbi:MAG: hypothetical protein Q9169_006094 [Polycauliona sp. 2 TL-2023]